ncbi:hypothetical protein ACE6H2_021211 [Prunus campanulata]
MQSGNPFPVVKVQSIPYSSSHLIKLFSFHFYHLLESIPVFYKPTSFSSLTLNA